MTSSLNCDLNNESGLVQISWANINDDYAIKNFLYDEFNQNPKDNSKIIYISVGEFLISLSNFIEFWKLNRSQITEFQVSENLKKLYVDIPDYEDSLLKKQPLSTEEVQSKLNSLGFKRKLKDTQLKNVAEICNLTGSANFSVPGAGKTTESLALFLLNKLNDNHKCLVISPINAFEAWEEEVPACLGDNNKSIILSGHENNIKKQLNNSATFYVINYEKLRSNKEIVKAIATKITSPGETFSIICDESHRMKGAQTSKTLSMLAPLSKHKIILSGTPCPQSYDDLISQFRFLYPKEESTDSDEIAEKFKSIFVRTTKSELISLLPKKIEEKIEINYSGTLRDVWDEITKPIKNRKFNLSIRTDLRDFNKIVIKLIRFCANPQLVLNEVYKIDQSLGDALADEGIGPKLNTLINDAVTLIKQGEKVVIWSSFPKNIDIIEKELGLYNANPVKIHGGIKKGDPMNGYQEYGTRRHAIHEFKNNPECMALIANPAAAGEGLSLHQVCRYALYNDRSYNVAHYLQSQDRIHRIGGDISKDVFIKVYSLKGMIDERISARLNKKTRSMSDFLNDKTIISNFTNYEIDYENDEKDFLDGNIENINFDIGDYEDLQNFIIES